MTDSRAVALAAYVCPDHGCPLEEDADWDEHGCLVTYWCFADPDGPNGPHTFGSAINNLGEYYPVEDR